MTARALRSVLFAPGSEPRKLARLATFDSDVIVVDLEDAVAESRKTAARGLTRETLLGLDTDALVAVRANGRTTGRLEDDIASVVVPRIDAIMVPKVEAPEDLTAADAAIAAAESEQRLEPGCVRMFALIESAVGLTRCEELLANAPPRLHTAVLGLGDLCADLGIELSPDRRELLYARSRIVAAARAAALPAPIDGPFFDLEDEAGLIDDTNASRRLGFQGRIAVHPAQVVHLNRGYATFDEGQVQRLRAIVEAFEAAEAGGSSSIRVDGEFVDYPIYRRAREQLVRQQQAFG